MTKHALTLRWIGIVLLCVWRVPAFSAGISDGELKAVALTAQDAIRKKDLDAFNSLWNNPVTIDHIVANIAAPPNVTAAFVRGMGKEVGKILGMAITKGLGKHGSYTFLGIKTIDGQRRPVLRMECDQGLNFHELIIEADADGKPRIVDMYVVLSGESIVQTQRRMLMMIANTGPNKEKLDPDVAAILNLTEKWQKGDSEGFLEAYDLSPEKAKHDRVVNLCRAMAAQRLGKQKLYVTALKDYIRMYREDATVDLLSIDLLFSKKDFDGAMNALNSLEQEMGTDGAIDFYRASIKLAAGDTKAALSYATEAVDEDPTLFGAADCCLSMALKRDDFPAVKKYLLILEKNHTDFKFGDLKNVALFKEFVTSPQYAEWQRERPKK